MKPIRSILDASFRYVASVATSVASTWRRAGWRPTTDEERKARRQPTAGPVVDCIGAAEAPPSVPRRASVSASSGKAQSAGRMRKTPAAPLRNVME
jgi:hypothetical protein